jgi:cytoskeletal protein CcmA (bactofilin family)
MSTIIGSSIRISGEVEGSEDLVVHGIIQGKIELQSDLIVEPSGNVEADVYASNTKISGTLTGNVQADERVEVTKDGQMTGDIRAPRILISDGAQFQGNVDMSAPRK